MDYGEGSRLDWAGCEVSLLARMGGSIVKEHLAL